MSIPEISEQSQDTSVSSFSEMSFGAFQEFSRIANKVSDVFLASAEVIGETTLVGACKAKNIFLGSACAVAGAALQGTAVLMKSALPPASGAVALFVSRDAMAYFVDKVYINKDKHPQMALTLLFAVSGSLALTYWADAIASSSRDLSAFCYTKSDTFFKKL